MEKKKKRFIKIDKRAQRELIRQMRLEHGFRGTKLALDKIKESREVIAHTLKSKENLKEEKTKALIDLFI